MDKTGKSIVFSFVTLFLWAYFFGPLDKAWAQKEKPLKVGIIPISDLLPLFVTKEKNFDVQTGINMEFVPMASGAHIQSAIAGGSLPLGLSNTVSLLLAKEQGFDFQVIAPNSNALGMGGIIVRNEPGIRSLKDLEGKTVAVNALKAVNWLYVRETMSRAGVNVDTVNFIEVPFPNMNGALINKQVDAISNTEPFITIAKDDKNLRFLLYAFDAVNPSGVVAFFIATTKWANANPDLVSRFARAYYKGVEYVNARPEEGRIILTKYTRLSEPLAKKIILPIWRTKFDVENLAWSADLMIAHGLLKSKINVEELIYKTAR